LVLLICVELMTITFKKTILFISKDKNKAVNFQVFVGVNIL
jgi:hypothetical protein